MTADDLRNQTLWAATVEALRTGEFDDPRRFAAAVHAKTRRDPRRNRDLLLLTLAAIDVLQGRLLADGRAVSAAEVADATLAEFGGFLGALGPVTRADLVVVLALAAGSAPLPAPDAESSDSVLLRAFTVTATLSGLTGVTAFDVLAAAAAIAGAGGG